MNRYSAYLSRLYRPPLAPDEFSGYIKLDRNEPAFAAFNQLDEFVRDKDVEQLLRVYPDPYAAYVGLASYYGVEHDKLLLTHGSEQGLRYIFDTFLDEKAEVVYVDPSFGMYDVYSYYKRAAVRKLMFGSDLAMPIKEILDSVTSKTQLLVIANPNSPTGTAYDYEDIVTLVEHTADTGTTFVIDEAYYHYYSLDTLSLLDRYPHLIVTRTLSKAWGLAGLRIGMIFSSLANIEILRSQKLVMELNQFSITLILEALKNADEIIGRNVLQVEKWKNIFSNTKLLKGKNLPSHGNFLNIQLSNYVADNEELLANRILVKKDFNDKCLENVIRVSVGSDSSMEQVLDILSK